MNKFGKYSLDNFLLGNNNRPKEFNKMLKIHETLISEDKDGQGKYSLRSEYTYKCEISLIMNEIEREILVFKNDLNDLRQWLPHNLLYYITLSNEKGSK